MALLLRLGGVPARVAAGFTSGQYDPTSHRWLVTDFDAHAWVEAFFPGYGWVRFDPTPASADPAQQKTHLGSLLSSGGAPAPLVKPAVGRHGLSVPGSSAATRRARGGPGCRHAAAADPGHPRPGRASAAPRLSPARCATRPPTSSSPSSNGPFTAPGASSRASPDPGRAAAPHGRRSRRAGVPAGDQPGSLRRPGTGADPGSAAGAARRARRRAGSERAAAGAVGAAAALVRRATCRPANLHFVSRRWTTCTSSSRAAPSCSRPAITIRPRSLSRARGTSPRTRPRSAKRSGGPCFAPSATSRPPTEFEAVIERAPDQRLRAVLPRPLTADARPSRRGPQAARARRHAAAVAARLPPLPRSRTGRRHPFLRLRGPPRAAPGASSSATMNAANRVPGGAAKAHQPCAGTGKRCYAGRTAFVPGASR